MTKLSRPPATLPPRASVRTLKAGTRLWRVFPAAGKHPTAWPDFRHYGPAASRFDHHPPPPRNHPDYGILYAAAHLVTCLAEYFQNTRVIDRALDDPHLAAFDLTKPVPLLNLTGAWPTRAGASMAINSGPRPRAREWSRAFYAAYPAVEGLFFASSMHANKPSMALYERALSALPAVPSFDRALSEPSLEPYLETAAKKIGYQLV